VKKYLLLSIISIIYSAASTRCAAQVLDPYEVPVDARSASLGEGFVAIASSPAGMFYNAAGLAQLQGTEAQYGYRTFPVSTPNSVSNYTNYSATLGSSLFGGFGVSYSTHIYDNPTIPVYNRDSQIIANNYNETSTILQIGYANHLSPTMDAGVMFGYSHRNISGLLGSAEWLDFGIRYHESLLKSRVPDEFSFGLSLTHIGSPIEYNDAIGSTETLPRTLRAGFAWHIAQPDTSWIANQFLSVLITGQYKDVLNQLNPGAIGYLGEENPNAKGYWSIGIETGAWDILFFRYGLLYRPYNSVYSNANNEQNSLGGGIKLPVHRLLSISTPVYLTFDYDAGYLLAGGHENIVTAGIHILNDFFPPQPQQDMQQ